MKDWRTLAHHLAENPTPLKILVSEYHNYLQYTYTCLLGSGGVITPGIQSIQPWVWKYAWPQNIPNGLVSHTNTKGRLTINDLELAELVLEWLVLEYLVEDMKFKHIGRFCDNTPELAWIYRGSTSTPIPVARLIRFLALRQLERKAS